MSKVYIHYKSKVGGFTGRNDVPLGVKKAKEHIDRLQKQHPGMIYWYQPVSKSNE